MSTLQEKQKIEIEYWRDSQSERPESNSIHNIVNKLSEAAIFLNCLSKYKNQLSETGKVLELGAGQGWASCVYKRQFPNAEMITTDISKYAIMSLQKWEG
jgi:cyclopropane fatty-acyl-phospholipid synthase-like methyltransferase